MEAEGLHCLNIFMEHQAFDIVEPVAGPRMRREDHWIAISLGQLVQRLDQRAETILGVDILLAVHRSDEVFSRFETNAAQNIRCFDLCTVMI